MSAIQYGLDRIIREIPKDILNLAFLRKSEYFSIPTSLDKQITDLCIRNIVLKDTNIVGGITITIPLEKCVINYYDNNPTGHNMVIFVPYNVTNNKKILEPLSLVGNVTHDTNYNISKNPIMSGMYNIYDHRANIGNRFATSNLEIIAPNTILVYDYVDYLFNGYLEIVVENNTNLSNISTRSYLVFGEICVEAAKLFIYNKLVLDIDKGVLYNGHELSKMSSIIESYSDAIDKYNELIKDKWGKITFMNDSVAMDKFIKISMSPYG